MVTPPSLFRNLGSEREETLAILWFIMNVLTPTIFPAQSDTRVFELGSFRNFKLFSRFGLQMLGDGHPVAFIW